MTNPTARVIDLTPQLASELLSRNPRNRKKSRANFITVKRAIENGEWMLNGEAIKISENGYILDGQHRCMAVEESGISIKTFLIEGLPDDTQDTMDTGKSRSLSDVLAIHGEISTNALAAVVTRFMALDLNGLESAVASSVGGRNYTIRERLDWFERNQWAREYVAPGKTISRGAPLGGATAALLMRVFDLIDEEDSRFFWARLQDGVGLPAGHPILVLLKSFRAISDDSKGERNQQYMAAITVKAWNAYRAGDSISILKFRPGGASPERFPTPR